MTTASDALYRLNRQPAAAVQLQQLLLLLRLLQRATTTTTSVESHAVIRKPLRRYFLLSFFIHDVMKGRTGTQDFHKFGGTAGSGSLTVNS